MKRKLAIVTSTRAEYGLLRRLIRFCQTDADFETALYVTGSHLDSMSGETITEIEQDGLRIFGRISIAVDADSQEGVARSMALACDKFARAFAENRPDLLILLGDRFEILGVAQAAFVLGIPIAHIHGGEVTTHAIDDSIRHAITKFGYFHFTTAEAHRRRVIQLGEDPGRVFNVGSPGLDNIRTTTLLDVDELQAELDWRIDQDTLLVTHHPETLRDSTEDEIQIVLEALRKSLQKNPALRIAFTAPNLDAGGRSFLEAIQKFCASDPKRAKLFKSLGTLRYLSSMKHAGAVVGNSSSGIIEAPFLNVPTVNIGLRQNGRLRATSIIDCALDITAIEAAIEKALAWRKKGLGAVESPYGGGQASEQIHRILKSSVWPQPPVKTFYDVEFSA